MIYFVDGDTFSGKTTYLREFIKNHPQKTSRYMTDEEWTELLAHCASETDSDEHCAELIASQFSEFDIVCIDNMDLLKGRPLTQVISAKAILELNQNRDILIAGIDLRSAIRTMIDAFSNNGITVSFIHFDRSTGSGEKAMSRRSAGRVGELQKCGEGESV